MKKNNVLPYDGETILIHDNSADFDWAALTRMLIGTIPWQVETAQLFGRELVVPRGLVTPRIATAASFIGRLRCRKSLSGCASVRKCCRVHHSMPCCSTCIGPVATALGGTATMKLALESAQLSRAYPSGERGDFNSDIDGLRKQ